MLMNPSEYLKSHGWRGEGFSLDSTDRGLAKPLLLRHKADSVGLGGQKRIGSGKDWSESGQWWSRLYEDTLKGFSSDQSSSKGTPESGSSPAPSIPPAAKTAFSNSRLKCGGLYGGFVKAATLGSTFTKTDRPEPSSRPEMGRKSKTNGTSSFANEHIPGEQLPDGAVQDAVTGGAEKTKKEKKKKKKKSSAEIVEIKEPSQDAVVEESSRLDQTDKNEKKAKKEKKERQEKKEKNDESGKNLAEQDDSVDQVMVDVSASKHEADREEKKKKQKQKNEKRDKAVALNGDGLQIQNETTTTGTIQLDAGEQAVVDAKPTSKKRKHRRDEDVIDETETSKKAKTEVLEEPTKSKKQLKREAAQEFRAKRKTENEAKKAADEERKAAEEEEKALDEANGDDSDSIDGTDEWLSNESRPEPVEEGPMESTVDSTNPHPESIAALRARGEVVNLPGDPTDSDAVRRQIIGALESGRSHLIDRIWNDALIRAKNRGDEKLEGVLADAYQPGKKLSYKGDKLVREKAKRVAKREAKNWAKVRENPHEYRPDGTHVSKPALGSEERVAKRAAANEERLQESSQQQARKSVKQQMKEERRKARKMRRAERKQQNHMTTQKQKSAKIQREKREKEEAAAAEKGMTYEAYVAEKQQNLAEKRRIRETERAEALGLTYEEYQTKKKNDIEAKEMGKEARKLGMDVDEYVNQPADIDHVKDIGEADPGLRDGTGDTFGRSPIDILWQRNNAAKQDTSKSGPDVNGASAAEAAAAAPPAKPADAAQAGDDFIPLAQKADSALFTIDTRGDQDVPVPSKKVKDMTKEERKARLEAMRAKRAERAARRGETQPKMNKKQRRKARLQRKEEIVHTMAREILAQKHQELNEAKGSTRGAGAPSKSAMKQATREARRIQRGLKKGRIRDEEVPEHWRLPARKKKKPKFSKA